VINLSRSRTVPCEISEEAAAKRLNSRVTAQALGRLRGRPFTAITEIDGSKWTP